MIQLTIDPEFKALIPPLSEDEYRQLEINIQHNGCRDAITVWIPPQEFYSYCEKCDKDVVPSRLEPQDGSWEPYDEMRKWDDHLEKWVSKDWDDYVEMVDRGEGYPSLFCPECGDFLLVAEAPILIDGHNRYEICQKHGIHFEISEVAFSDRQEAINWIIDNQLGRRNLNPDQQSYLRGKRYNAVKESKGGDRGNQYVAKGQNDPLPESTADRLAQQYQVSEKTIKRDGQYAAAVDTLASVGVEPQKIIANASKADVINLAKEIAPQPVKLLFPEPERQPPPLVAMAIEEIKQGTPPKEVLKEIKAVKQQTIIEPVVTSYITLEDWSAIPESERQNYLKGIPSGKTFNRQEKDNEDSIGNIEWAKWSWNPVSGCKHDCPYCYARDIANRFYAQGFVPTLYPDRLTAPRNTRVPSAANNDISLKNVFTCSMADLFGRWVPTEWIESVLQQVRDNPQWNFLFLTKFPKRLAEFKFPENAWLGTTVDCQARVKAAEDAFRKLRDDHSGGVWWLSLEPLIEPLQFTELDMFDWVVIGGASPSTKTPEWHPPRKWINDLEDQAIKSGCKIYEKTNLLSRIRQYPGLYETEPTSAPVSFKYLGD